MPHEHDPKALEEVHTKVEKAYAAWKQYASWPQERMDAVVEKAAEAGRLHARRLAEMAVEETGYGNVEDKVAKNLLCADFLPRAMRGMKLVGLLRELPDQKIVEYGVPVGVIAAIIPTTNPTSTAIYKILISLKSGNAVVISPHPRARRCTCETAELLYRAALEAGAPEGIIQCLTNPTREATQALMRHERTAVILATGGHGIVRAAYSSGKPAFGVGPGNVAVLVDRTANIPDAVAKIVQGKSFDYGTVCSSEQALVAEQALRATILNELKLRKAHLCTPEQKEALGKLLVTPQWTIDPKCVGQSPVKLAEMAGFSVPPDTSILVAELEGVGKQHPLSMEKLSPVLALYFVKDWPAALETCEAVTRFGGLGHTAVIFSKDDSRIREFAERIPAMRILVNTPAPHGSVGLTTNVFPSMTLGCGAAAGNSTSDNVGPQHLINIKRLAYAVRQPEEALTIPKPAYAVPTPSPGEVAVPVGTAPAAKWDRQTVMAAVEQYLAQRGIRLDGAPAPPSSPPTGSSTAPVAAEALVDRFLAARRAAKTAASQAAQTAPVCGCPHTPEGTAVSPAIQVVDFVCENDVREAIRASRKIHIGPKTIVTPAARELADRHDVLVFTQPT
ncbi:MAG: aldehyde dehydrogenase family protein [Bryobacterales bacterium]|nr:aldehyde dehydrogenase family protein [Bryobacteraceae bacterium]MDW8355023.1 aldehyde dehydrogenase family protein [Bryobacterales bacterium]